MYLFQTTRIFIHDVYVTMESNKASNMEKLQETNYHGFYHFYFWPVACVILLQRSSECHYTFIIIIVVIIIIIIVSIFIIISIVIMLLLCVILFLLLLLLILLVLLALGLLLFNSIEFVY